MPSSIYLCSGYLEFRCGLLVANSAQQMNLSSHHDSNNAQHQQSGLPPKSTINSAAAVVERLHALQAGAVAAGTNNQFALPPDFMAGNQQQMNQQQSQQGAVHQQLFGPGGMLAGMDPQAYQALLNGSGLNQPQPQNPGLSNPMFANQSPMMNAQSLAAVQAGLGGQNPAGPAQLNAAVLMQHRLQQSQNANALRLAGQNQNTALMNALMGAGVGNGQQGSFLAQHLANQQQPPQTSNFGNTLAGNLAQNLAGNVAQSLASSLASAQAQTADPFARRTAPSPGFSGPTTPGPSGGSAASKAEMLMSAISNKKPSEPFGSFSSNPFASIGKQGGMPPGLQQSQLAALAEQQRALQQAQAPQSPFSVAQSPYADSNFPALGGGLDNVNVHGHITQLRAAQQAKEQQQNLLLRQQLSANLAAQKSYVGGEVLMSGAGGGTEGGGMTQVSTPGSMPSPANVGVRGAEKGQVERYKQMWVAFESKLLL